MWLVGDLSPPLSVSTVLSAFVICIISFYVFKWLSGEGNVPIRDSTKNHSWTPIKITSKAWYCSICESFLLNGIGVYCDCCGVCADPECVKKANTKLQCKVVTSSSDHQPHHWVKGNLPLGATCCLCNEDCSMEPGLIDYQCCWCQRTAHTDCLPKLPKECDFGPFRNMIVPPWCVQVARRKGALNKHLLLRAVKDPGWKNWTPLVVIANKKSGNNDGALVLSEFRRYLNPVQVIDLSTRKPPAALQWAILLAPKEIKILVGGGDGTVAWVLSSSHKLDLDPEPPIAIVPLGTGNDLSRVLGWGKENPPELDVGEILQNVQNARVTQLDRWKVEITSSRHLGLRIPNKTLFMYNYIGIGVDAQVALNFHKTRDSLFYVFNGNHVELPELESIVILNIPSWGAGVNLWGMLGNTSIKPSQSYHDGILEVLGIYSSFHIAQLQVGLSTPLKLGQARTVEVRLKAKSPIQIDGEPWEQHPAFIRVTLVNRCPVLVNQTRN
ncbi:diacylglycerol kinase epsilon [Asbolus verrucosus]|uniref:Diacylglycerol kinase n=1 Tax=Asbolus verrucosus TaxID=1661398 RepID=A0A482W3U2_ASBVE|nr:diacylglycerol kinase epsilon [Asbolus verrucosus]